eukprot:CAMPEP_0114158140 /NCGR_PEP_ID=MMETSP0043_2-20121206/27028_1 /TAXON_ID=464988 /ORGANISM="Hemiselmis andersenii, Strain CCMP644" /LENGTH=51 /DNA_ID=CAMNT_0001253819 /DNA_START=181 /DNA_END=333 /DNA_ORIENTATION=+
MSGNGVPLSLDGPGNPAFTDDLMYGGAMGGRSGAGEGKEEGGKEKKKAPRK